MASSSLSRLLARSSVGRRKSTSFAQARAGIIGTATQDQRNFRREYIAGNPPSGTSTRIIIEAEFDDQPESRDLGMPAPEPATVGAVNIIFSESIQRFRVLGHKNPRSFVGPKTLEAKSISICI